jgi:membrane peptidoglycan carboxypeptidase
MSSIMQGVIKEGTGYPNADIGRPAAGKTGTTSDYRDAWFVGFTPDLVTAVWLGNDNYTQMYESYGGNVPARTWARFMRAALAKVPKHEFTFPAGELKKVAYCGRPGAYEYFLVGTATGSCASGTYYYRRPADTGYTVPVAKIEPIRVPNVPSAAALRALAAPAGAADANDASKPKKHAPPPPQEAVEDGHYADAVKVAPPPNEPPDPEATQRPGNR